MTLRLAFALSVVLFFQPALGDESRVMRRSFPEAIAELDRDYLLAQQSNIGELKLLSRMPEFINFSALSDEYAEDCVHYLAEPRHNWQQRQIAMLSMRTLELDRFVWFAKRVLDLNAENLVSPREVMDAILPGKGFSRVVERNSLNPSIRAVLYRMKSVDGLTPEDIGYINDLIYGKVYLESLFRSR